MRHLNRLSLHLLPTPPAIPPIYILQTDHIDYFDCAGQHYLVVGGRLSRWSEVFQAPKASPQAGSNGLISCLCNYFSRFGVPKELSRDCLRNCPSSYQRNGQLPIKMGSAYNPQSNGIAEVAVKSAKRLLCSNTGQVTRKYLRKFNPASPEIVIREGIVRHTFGHW